MRRLSAFARALLFSRRSLLHTRTHMSAHHASAGARADADRVRRGRAGARGIGDAHDAAPHLTGPVLRNGPESTALSSAHVPTSADEGAFNPSVAEAALPRPVVAASEDALRFGSHGASSNLSAANHVVDHVAQQAQDSEEPTALAMNADDRATAISIIQKNVTRCPGQVQPDQTARASTATLHADYMHPPCLLVARWCVCRR